MNTAKTISALGLCAATLAGILFTSIPTQAGEVANAIAAGTLTDTDAVAYIIYGLEHGGRPPHQAGGVTRGRTPGNFEIKYDSAQRAERVFEKIGDCEYQVTSRVYPYTALTGQQPEPKTSKFDLNFSKVTRALVIKGDEWNSTIDLFGLACTPHENGQETCEALAKSELYTAADGPTLVKTLAYFHEKYCPIRP